MLIHNHGLSIAGFRMPWTSGCWTSGLNHWSGHFSLTFEMNFLKKLCLVVPVSLLCDQLCLVVQYIPRNMHTVFALLCFVVVIHWLIFPYPSGLLHWHCGNLTIAPVPAKQPWWIWINTSCEFIMNDCITTTKQSTTQPCAYFLGYTVPVSLLCDQHLIVMRLYVSAGSSTHIRPWSLSWSFDWD